MHSGEAHECLEAVLASGPMLTTALSVGASHDRSKEVRDSDRSDSGAA
jgi:hypothetical protein